MGNEDAWIGEAMPVATEVGGGTSADSRGESSAAEGIGDVGESSSGGGMLPTIPVRPRHVLPTMPGGVRRALGTGPPPHP